VIKTDLTFIFMFSHNLPSGVQKDCVTIKPVEI